MLEREKFITLSKVITPNIAIVTDQRRDRAEKRVSCVFLVIKKINSGIKITKNRSKKAAFRYSVLLQLFHILKKIFIVIFLLPYLYTTQKIE